MTDRPTDRLGSHRVKAEAFVLGKLEHRASTLCSEQHTHTHLLHMRALPRQPTTLWMGQPATLFCGKERRVCPAGPRLCEKRDGWMVIGVGVGERGGGAETWQHPGPHSFAGWLLIIRSKASKRKKRLC